MLNITNVVVSSDLNCQFNLSSIAKCINNCVYDPGKYSGLVWHHRKIKSKCFVFHTGKILCMGNNSVVRAKKDLRKYAKLLQKHDDVKLNCIHVVTKSVVVRLKGKINLREAAYFLNGFYEPEIFNAVMFKEGSAHFTCFQTGKIIITGVKQLESLYPMLMSIELFVYT